MGTRNLSMAKVDGVLKIAQYGQWDGYPSGAGVEILSFIKRTDMNEFKDKVRKCNFVEPEHIRNLWESLGADKSGVVSMDIASKMEEQYPQFSRDTGCQIFKLVNESDGMNLDDAHEFGEDGLFCEWAYLIDFDEGCLSVYANGVSEASLVDKFSFEVLKEMTKEEFVNILEPIEE